MKESHRKGVAIHLTPSHAGPRVREGTTEALTGACAGKVLSPEKPNLGCRRSLLKRKATSTWTVTRAHVGSHGVRDPYCTRRNSTRENRETLKSPRPDGGRGRVGKEKG